MNTVSSIVVEIKAIGSEFTSAWQGYKQKVEDFNRSIENGNAALTKMATAVTALLGFEQLKSGVEAAQEMNVALAQLDQVLKTTGQGIGDTREELIKLAETEEQLTGVHKEQIVSLEAILFSYGATAEQVMKLTPIVLDASSRLGRSPEMIARSLGEATQGNTAGLRTFGITVRESGEEIKTFDGVLALLGHRFDGAAAAAFQAKGPLGQLQLVLFEFQESLGQLILTLGPEFFSNLAQGIKKASDYIQNFPKLHPELVQQIKEIAGDFGKWAVPIGAAIAALLTLRGGFMAINSVVALFRTSLFAVTAGFETLMGFSIADFFVTATASLAGLNTALGILAIRLATLLPILALVAVGLKTAKAEWDMFKAKAEQSATAMDADTQLDHFNKTISENVDAIQKSGEITAEHAKKTKEVLNQIRIAYAQGSISVDQYRRHLAQVADQVRAIHPAGFVGPQTPDVQVFSAKKIIDPETQKAIDESAKVMDEIHRSFLESTGRNRELLKQEYDDALAVLRKKVTDDQDYEEGKYELKKIYDAKVLELDRKRAEQETANRRAALEGRIRSIVSNPLLTDDEKNTQQLPIQKQLLQLDHDRAAVLNGIIGDSKTSDEARLTAEKELNELTQQRAELEQQIAQEQGKNSVIYQLKSQWASFYNAVSNTAGDLASFAMSPFAGMKQGLASAIDTLLTKGATLKQFFGSVALSIAQSMIGAFSQMVANWIMSHVVMAGVEIAFYELCTALGFTHLAAVTAAKLAEVGIHVGAEGTKTAVTTAGAITRIGASAAEAGAGAAASQASIPYIGPILAIAAMGAIMAAVLALAGGFQVGGYTGDGPVNQIAGVVHRGEYVIPASRVRQHLPLLQAIHSGSLADMMAPSARIVSSPVAQAGGGSGQSSAPIIIKPIIVHDAKAAALEAMASPAGEKVHIMHTNKNRGKVGIQT